MMRGLAEYLANRQPRERWLLFGLIAVIAPLGFWFLVLSPIAERTRSIEARTEEANALLLWVAGQAATFDPTVLTVTEVNVQPPPGVADVERSVHDAGLAPHLARLSSEGDGRIELGFDSVPFQPVMTWLRGQRDKGLALVQLRIEAVQNPGEIRLNAVLEPEL